MCLVRVNGPVDRALDVIAGKCKTLFWTWGEVAGLEEGGKHGIVDKKRLWTSPKQNLKLSLKSG